MFHIRLTITNTDKQQGACALKWNTIMDDLYWASAVEVWKGNTPLSYSKPVIPLHQRITQTDYEYFGKSIFTYKFHNTTTKQLLTCRV